MAYTVTIFKASGEIKTTTQNAKPTYSQIKEAVGGMIETIPYFKSYNGYTRGSAFAHEEGLIRGFDYNRNASEAWMKALAGQSGVDPNRVHLVGDVIFYAKVPSGATTIASGTKSPREQRGK